MARFYRSCYFESVTMHIPDGFLSPPVWVTLDAVAIPSVGWMARRAQQNLEENQIPLLGVMGAFVFAAQMINFPVGIGTSGHLVGGALLAFTLGPAAASLVLTAILLIQSLVFQDGGVLALGANVLNMAVFGVWAGYLPYRWLRGRRTGLFLGGALSVLVSACLALAELLLSGVRMPVSLVLLSLALFLVSGLMEGAITLAVVQSIERINPQWVPRRAPPRAMTAWALAGAAVFLAAVGVLFASTSPDGLERFAENAGIGAQAKAIWAAPLAEYEWSALASPYWRKATAGLAGLMAIYALCLLLGRVLGRRRSA